LQDEMFKFFLIHHPLVGLHSPMSLGSNRLLAQWFLEEWDRTRPVTVQVCNRNVAVNQPCSQLAVFPTDIYQNIPRQGLLLNPVRTRSTWWGSGRSWMGF